MADTYYDAIASGYDELHGAEQLQKLSAVVAAFPFSFDHPISILDVGCGTGISSRIGEMLERTGIRVASVIGVDPSEGLLARNPYPHRKAPAEALPFPDASFDLVVSLTAAQNFEDIGKAVSEMARVGKGGFIVSILARSAKTERLRAALERHFSIVRELRAAQDIIFFAGKRKI